MKTSTKFLGGAVAGLALVVAASLFLSSKKGKKLTGEAQEKIADFYQHIGPKLAGMKKMGKKEYGEFIEKAVTEYAKVKKISGQAAKELLEQAHASWENLAEYLGKE